jgi:hypothetical protein
VFANVCRARGADDLRARRLVRLMVPKMGSDSGPDFGNKEWRRTVWLQLCGPKIGARNWTQIWRHVFGAIGTVLGRVLRARATRNMSFCVQSLQHCLEFESARALRL